MPSRMPPNAADFAADRTPVRNCNRPPVNAAAAMLFHGSSFFLTATSVQSNVEKSPPQTAKLPPILGASRRMDSMPPRIRAPDGAFFMPLSRCHKPPPTAPMPKAPPTSSRILSGHGSCVMTKIGVVGSVLVRDSVRMRWGERGASGMRDSGTGWVAGEPHDHRHRTSPGSW